MFTVACKLKELRGTEAEKNKAEEAMKSTSVLFNTNYSFCQTACFGWAASCMEVKSN